MLNNFEIEGKSVVLREPVQHSRERRSARRLFDAKMFTNGTKHEIANHFRDYKMGKNIQKRRRKNSVKIFKDFSEPFNYREVLQIPCFIFPRFSEVFPWRGRKTICELKPPDDIRHLSVNRIREATTLEEFEYLVERQNRLYNNDVAILRSKHKQNPIKWTKKKIRGNNCKLLDTNPIDGAVTRELKPGNRIQDVEIVRQRKVKRKLGYVRQVDNFRGVFNRCQLSAAKAVTGQGEFNHEDIGNVTNIDNHDEYLIQLASDCYDKGFESHLEYLEAIGKRNATRRSRKQSGCSASSSRSLSSNSTDSFKFLRTVKPSLYLKRPVGKRSRRNQICSYDQELPLSSDCSIRVNITRTGSEDNQQRNGIVDYTNSLFHSDQLGCFLKRRVPEKDCSSMNDFPIITNSYAVNWNGSVSSGSNRSNNVSDLADSLSGLQINDYNSLPRIILTDFSSQDTTGTSTPSTPVPLNRITNKLLSFEFTDFDSCLNIPNEKSYRNEARPP